MPKQKIHSGKGNEGLGESRIPIIRDDETGEEFQERRAKLRVEARHDENDDVPFEFDEIDVNLVGEEDTDIVTLTFGPYHGTEVSGTGTVELEWSGADKPIIAEEQRLIDLPVGTVVKLTAKPIRGWRVSAWSDERGKEISRDDVIENLEVKKGMIREVYFRRDVKVTITKETDPDGIDRKVEVKIEDNLRHYPEYVVSLFITEYGEDGEVLKRSYLIINSGPEQQLYVNIPIGETIEIPLLKDQNEKLRGACEIHAEVIPSNWEELESYGVFRSESKEVNVGDEKEPPTGTVKVTFGPEVEESGKVTLQYKENIGDTSFRQRTVRRMEEQEVPKGSPIGLIADKVDGWKPNPDWGDGENYIGRGLIEVPNVNEDITRIAIFEREEPEEPTPNMNHLQLTQLTPNLLIPML